MRHLFAFLLPLLLVGCIQEAKWTWTGDTPGDAAVDGVTADGAGEVGSPDLKVEVDVCTPNCEGKECGDDGCGGTCGECDDEDLCDGEEICEDGQCIDGTALDCDDGNVCTDDSCEALQGCVHVALDGEPCEDGNPCTLDDVCVDDDCQGGAWNSCDDENPCTDDSCKVGAGCQNDAVPDGAEPACDDGNPCTEDLCASGDCANPLLPLDQLVIEDCLCEEDADCADLNDDNLCNGSLICDTEAEVPACMVDEETIVTCALPDSVAPECNVPVCVPDTGDCGMGYANEDGPCEDGNACTSGELCKDGECKNGGSVFCEDSNGCTDDSCDPATGCVNIPNTDSCDDDNDCTHTDLCSNGTCGGTEYECDQPEQCETVEGATCIGDGTCTYPTAPMDSMPCDDGNACNVGEACADGACAGGGELDCDDGNVCTDDSCNPVSGCVHVYNSKPCSDDDLCTTGDHCSNGSCVTTGTVDCEENEFCEAGLCQPLCGNGICDLEDTCETCPGDCDVCPAGCDPPCEWSKEECILATTGGWFCTPRMIEVSAGTFCMGCNNCAGSTVNDTDCYDREHPYHEVYLDSYEIDRTKVTASQYLSCVTAGGCTIPAGIGSNDTYQVAGKEDHPINYVDWSHGEAYCQWAGKTLCTEAQWEKGARGGCEHNGGVLNCKAQSRMYPWGNDAPTCSLAVMFGCSGDTQSVCSLSPAGDSPYGLCDMAGNVLEWTADWYGSDYYCAGSGADTSSPWTFCTECGSWPGSPAAWSNPGGPGSGSSRGIRGASFSFDVVFLRVSSRYSAAPSAVGDGLGFRCCRSE